MNLYQKYLNYQHFVLYAQIFFGNKNKIFFFIGEKTKLLLLLLFIYFLRGFSYQGYQCQRCDCVVHKGCYKDYACPCKGKKYPDVRYDIENY